MEDSDLKHRFHLIQTEIEATASLLKDAKIDLTSAVDSIKIEMEILKTFIGALSSRVRQESMRPSREEAIQTIDPEWAGGGTEAENNEAG